MTTVVASSNLVFTLSDAAFEAGLRKVLADQPDICALQEALNHRDNVIRRVCDDLGYDFAAAKGGEPILWKTSRYRFRSVHGVRLARAEFVGHLPGRKDRLPASIATEVCLDDLASKHPDGSVTDVIDYHLTAEIQDVRGGGGYKKDAAHRLRVRRHKREKRRLGKRARMHQRRGRTVHPCGDGNYSGMTLGGFVNCWEGRHGGTLQGRPVDIIFGARKPSKLWTIETASDHDSLIVTYP